MDYHIIFSSRTTLCAEVKIGGEVIIRAPRGTSRNKIEKLQKIIVVKSKWDKIKESGIAGAPRGDATVALKNIILFLNNLKIFLVPCGELECFIKDAGGHGPEWLNNVLENYPDLNSEEYKSAREFVSSWNL